MNEQPVIIGGVGGSGTRVISEALILMGFDMGHTLNHASDNLLFTLLFKRKQWLLDNIHNDAIVRPVIELFCQLSGYNSRLAFENKLLFLRIFFDWMRNKETVSGLGRRFAYKNAQKVLNNRKKSRLEADNWGFKEPNSWLFLPHFKNMFPKLKYIHTIRHGVDMSLSENQQQCINWSKIVLGEDVSATDCTPQKSLKYWLKANEQVMKFGEQLPPNRFLVVKFEDLCEKPVETMERLITFLDAEITPQVREAVLALPQASKCKHKFTNEIISSYDTTDLRALERFGYAV